MIDACRQFLSARLEDILNADQQPFDSENIFFEPMPRDFLKTRDFAACCLASQDKKTRDGRLVASVRDDECTKYTRTYRVYKRKVLYQVVLFASEFRETWGETDFKGFIDQFEEGVAAVRSITDSLGIAVHIDLHDSIRPWNSEEADRTIRRRGLKAIARVEFTGGVHRQTTVPIIGDVEITPSVGA